MSNIAKDEEVLKRAKKRFKEIVDHERYTRELMKNDLDAYYSDIWESVAPGWRQTMENYGRPVLEMHRMEPIIRRVINDVTNMEPEIKTIARNTVDKEKAENRQGVIRHILYNSDSQEAISLACLHACIMGRGHFRIRTEYNENSNNQYVCFDPIKKPLNVYMSKNRRTTNYTDCDYAFIIDRMTKEDFKLEYPNSDPVNWEGENEEMWFDSEDVMIVEYYEFETKRRKMITFLDGSEMYDDEINPEMKKDAKYLKSMSRDVVDRTLVWRKMTGREVLESAIIPGTRIPICTVIAEEGEDSDGQLVISGLVRRCKGPAWLYDLSSSLEAENMHQNSINPWIGDPEQFEGLEHLYAEANRVPRAYLPAHTIVKEGIVLSRPERVQPIPLNGMTQIKYGYIDDMFAASGVNEERMGMQSNAQSGKAINARSQESKMTNSNLTRSLGAALTYAGRIINKWIPIYYDTNRLVRILDIEMKPKTVELKEFNEEGQSIDLGEEYDDIIVTMGPSYLSGRLEAMDGMLQFIQAIPNLAPVVADLIAENSDWPGSTKIAERIRATMPPEVLEANGGAEQIAMKLNQAMQQLQQSEQMIQMLKQALDQATQELETKESEFANKIDVEQLKADANIQVALIRQETDLAKTKADLWASIRKPVSKGA
jgi:hypothetical protein